MSPSGEGNDAISVGEDAGGEADAGGGDEEDAAETDAEETDAGETDAGETDAEETDAEETDAGETDAEETDAEETDAGETDAGETDAEETDAEETDAGETDAEETDAGETDAGETDAGETDAGETDAGETDAGETDAGETDAGETDAGETDAGETDAGEDSAPLDRDEDGTPDESDVCPDVADDQSDSDGDGLGDACDDDIDGDGVLGADDCDDRDGSIGAPMTWYLDADADGLGDPATSLEACEMPGGFVANAEDLEPLCQTNDTDICGICAGPGAPTWYRDADEDGLGDPTLWEQACAQPEGFVANNDDDEPSCATNDTDLCGICAGPGASRWYGDADADGLGDPAVWQDACSAPDGFVSNADDAEPSCTTNDTDACGVCAGPGSLRYWLDQDGDGLGDSRVSVLSCANPDGYVANADDAEPDCATNDTDECGVCAGPGETTYYGDADSDGLGDPTVVASACSAPDGFVDNASDTEPECTTNDTDSCGVCGGPGGTTYYGDMDGDGLGDPAMSFESCDGAPEGFVSNANDLEPGCTTNDTDECGVCAGPGAPTWYADGDQDGLGDPLSALAACEAPDNYVSNPNDPEPSCTTNDTDDCGVCAGANADMDCSGVCFGSATVDGCDRCSGGLTGVEPATDDTDGDGFPDLCDQCNLPGGSKTIIQFENVALFSAAGGPFTFQIILWENGDFEFVYEDMEPFDGVTATVGTQSAAGALFTLLGYNSEFAREFDHVYFRYDDATGIAEVEYTEPRVWFDIRHIGTPLGLGDDTSEQVVIPHGFPFYGEVYDTVQVSSNGVLYFGGPTPGYNNSAFPSASLGAVIAAFWDDLNPSRTGEVYFYNEGPGCAFDCDGQAGGVALEDSCGLCIGGTTGTGSADAIDCNGECFGEAYQDICGICVGGSTGLDPSDPSACPNGPDLVVDTAYLGSRLFVDYIDADANPCYVNENCLGGPGLRKVIRFGTRIGNIGNEPLALGVPPANGTNNGSWIWDECHGHHHYEAYAEYQVYNLDGDPMIDGAKNGFCVMDLGTYRPELVQGSCNVYNCGNQGIGVGCQDTYSSGLSCQWVDVTDVPDGDYILEVVTNPQATIFELDTTNNSASIQIRMTGDSIELLD